MAFFAVFTVMHVTLVFVAHPDHNLTQMVLGEADPARFAQALTMTIIGLVAVMVLWLAAGYWSLPDLRRGRMVSERLTEPIRRMTVNRLVSRQRRKQVWTEKESRWSRTPPASLRKWPRRTGPPSPLTRTANPCP